MKDSNISISITNDSPHALSGWNLKQVKDLNELSFIVKNFKYSNAIFKNNYRKGENVESFNNLIIYDIDNDKDKPNLSLDSAIKHFKKLDFKALIIPSKSHNIEKNGYIANRYRILIPTQTPLTLTNKDEFREFQSLVAKALNIESFVDKAALNDKARFYNQSPNHAQPIIIESNNTMDIKKLELEAKNNIANKQKQKQIELEKLKAIKLDSKEYKKVPMLKQSDYLTYINSDGFNTILNKYSIANFVRKLENVKDEYNDGYNMIKTPTAKYALIESDNLLHDFKSGETYNVYTYLAKILNTNIANNIAREFEKMTGENVLSLNQKLIDTHLKTALKTATNDKSLESNLKKLFKVEVVKFHYGSGDPYLQIADKKITNLDFKNIIEMMRKNRENINLKR